MRTSASEKDPGRFRMWLGHHAHIIWLVAASFAVFSDLLALTHIKPSTYPQIAITLMGAIIWPLAIASGLSQALYHDRQLCTRCLDDTPLLNSNAVVERRMRELRAFHSPIARSIFVGVSGLFLLTSFDQLLSASKNESASTLNLALDALALVVLAYNSFVFLIHRRLTLWCPWCRDDDDGDEEAPDNPPGPTSGRKIKRTGVVRLKHPQHS